MRIRDGEEFLEKLGNLDPDLVAEADRPVDRESRGFRRRGPGIGTWIAAAACLCALCLPMILRTAFPPAVEELTAGGADTSHQLEDTGEGGADQEEETAIAREGESALVEDSAAGTTFYHPGPDGWELAVFHQEYVESLPEGLPAKYYFINNSQEAGEKALWDEDLESDFGVEYVYTGDWLADLLPSLEGDWATRAFPAFGESGLLSKLTFQWDSQQEGGYITVNVVEQPEEILPKDQEQLRAYMKQYGQTIVERNGLEVTALGGLETDKTLSFWRNGWFYRIYGDKDADVEAMVQLLDWLLDGGFQLADYTKDRAQAMARLQDCPDAFAGYYPTDPGWVPKAAKGILEMEGDTPLALELDYPETLENGEAALFTYWLVGTAEYAQRDIRYPAPEKALPDLTQADVLSYLEERQEAGENQFAFWWDERVKAVFWYREDASPQQIWAFIQHLQSGGTKTERMIGDIVQLQPYA